MLIVTGQPFPVKPFTKADGTPSVQLCSYSEVQADVDETMGMPLMEVVPITTFQDTLASLFMSSFALPQCFCVFDVASEDVICVDKRAYYQGFMHAGKPVYEHIDESAPQSQKLYFVNMRKLTKEPLICGDVEAILAFREDETAFSKLLEFRPVKQTAPGTFVKDVQKRVQKIELGDINEVAEVCRQKGILNPEGHARVLSAWRVYRYVIAPILLWDVCSDTGSVHMDNYKSLNLELAAVESCTRTWNACDMWVAQLGAWLSSEMSLDVLEDIYQGLKKMIIADFSVLGVWLTGTKIGVNDPCPCGSGLKYKKCHGVWR